MSRWDALPDLAAHVHCAIRLRCCELSPLNRRPDPPSARTSSLESQKAKLAELLAKEKERFAARVKAMKREQDDALAREREQLKRMKKIKALEKEKVAIVFLAHPHATWIARHGHVARAAIHATKRVWRADLAPHAYPASTGVHRRLGL